MVHSAKPDTEELVRRAARGDDAARQQLLVRHRGRLKRMVTVRMDRRLASRVDPSDVVQETLAEAARKLPDYLRERPLPFYAWIRRLALEHMVRQHRRHIRARGRSLTREEQHAAPLPDHSAIALAMQLVAHGTSPSEQAVRQELRAKVRQVLDRLAPQDREVLILRYLEQLSADETAAVLGLTVAGVKSRHRRALERFTRRFGPSSEGDRP